MGNVNSLFSLYFCMFPHPRDDDDVQYMHLSVYNMCRTHLSTPSNRFTSTELLFHIKNAPLILFHSVNMSILTLFIYLFMNTVVRSLIITAVFDFHMTFMKKIPLWMLWFHVVRLVSTSMYTCVNSQYYQPSENYILIQAADWAKQENRIRLVVWNRNSIDSKERQEVALIIAFYKDFFLSPTVTM